MDKDSEEDELLDMQNDSECEEIEFTIHPRMVDRNYCRFVIYHTFHAQDTYITNPLNLQFASYPDPSPLQELVLLLGAYLSEFYEEIEDKFVADRFYYLLLVFTPGLDNEELLNINKAIHELFDFSPPESAFFESQPDTQYTNN